MIESDTLIAACRWVVDAEAEQYKQRAFENCKGCYTTLLNFFREEGLLANPALGQNVDDWMQFEIRASDLTPEGLALYGKGEPRWKCGYGQEYTLHHLVQWKRRLAEMRSRAA